MLAELQKNPNQARYVFYLAQTYAVSGQLEKALETYQKRIALENDEEEIFWSLYCIGCLQSDLQYEDEIVIESFLQAFSFDSSRAEPLYRLASHFQRRGSYILGYLVLQQALTLPLPDKALRIQHAVYQYLLLIKFAELAGSIGHREESLNIYKALLNNPQVPEEAKTVIQKNIELLSFS